MQFHYDQIIKSYVPLTDEQFCGCSGECKVLQVIILLEWIIFLFRRSNFRYKRWVSFKFGIKNFIKIYVYHSTYLGITKARTGWIAIWHVPYFLSIAYADHLKRALLSRNSSVMTKLLSFSNMRNRSMKNEFWPACCYVLLYLRDSSCNLFPKGNIVELHVLSLCKSLFHPFFL